MNTALENMTVWGLVSEASLLVKLVMLTLVLASLASWYLIVLRGWSLRTSERSLKVFLRKFRSGQDIGGLYAKNAESISDGDGLQHIFQAGYHEFSHLRSDARVSPDAIMSGVEHALQVAISEQEERLENGLSFLATVGSVSPYIGLFGTVWGIMNSFMGLAQVQQATLSTVAPGIAEALIATAIGLFAAIPAVIAYNRYSARTQMLTARYYSFASELQACLHRRLQVQPVHAAAA